jgi:hypothetical protein
MSRPPTVCLGPGWLPAELVARCVIAACVALERDPFEVMTAPKRAPPRSILTAAASGLAATGAVTARRACGALEIDPSVMSAARGRAKAAFTLAEGAAKEAALYWLKARGWQAPAVLSTRRASLTVGKPAPPKVAPPVPGQPTLGRNPADAAAQQLGKSEVGLRAAYDPTFRGMGNG